HNANFERLVEEHILAPRYGWPLAPIGRQRCTMAMALACALPAKLETLAEALQLGHRKDEAGHRLMLQMARPRKPRPGEDPAGIYWHDDPERRRRLGEYCKQDLRVEREAYYRLPPLIEFEQRNWQLDAVINDRGFYTQGAL